MERPNTSGFSLFELLITLAIVAILASITAPSYTGLVAKSRRADAMAALAEIQLAQERWRAAHPEYAKSLSDLGWPSADSHEGFYELRIVEAGAGDYLVLAQPVGPQQVDVCKTFASRASGPVYRFGYAGPSCWQR
ncbi:MAG: type IV pilin protein [Thiogranum sp.]|nr:type IV pilin protein [Thiogranum sp.]